jgi:hypothetical protein
METSRVAQEEEVVVSADSSVLRDDAVTCLVDRWLLQSLRESNCMCVRVCLFFIFLKKKTIPEKKRLSQTSPYRLIATMLAQASIIEVLKERTR